MKKCFIIMAYLLLPLSTWAGAGEFATFVEGLKINDTNWITEEYRLDITLRDFEYIGLEAPIVAALDGRVGLESIQSQRVDVETGSFDDLNKYLQEKILAEKNNSTPFFCYYFLLDAETNQLDAEAAHQKIMATCREKVADIFKFLIEDEEFDVVSLVEVKGNHYGDYKYYLLVATDHDEETSVTLYLDVLHEI